MRWDISNGRFENLGKTVRDRVHTCCASTSAVIFRAPSPACVLPKICIIKTTRRRVATVPFPRHFTDRHTIFSSREYRVFIIELSPFPLSLSSLAAGNVDKVVRIMLTMRIKITSRLTYARKRFRFSEFFFLRRSAHVLRKMYLPTSNLKRLQLLEYFISII